MRPIPAVPRVLGSLLSGRGRRGRLAIFTYHQVLERKDRLRSGEPDEREFRADVEILAGTFAVLPLAEAARGLVEGTLPARAASITFDDGYANNYALAAPILEAAGVPATFFVTPGAIDTGVMWNDLVIEAIAAGAGPPELEALPGIDGAALRGRSGAALVSAALGQLKYQPLEQRLASARSLYERTLDGEVPRLMMTRQMVAELAGRGHDVGGHTVNHPILKELPDAEARREIEECSMWIASVTGRRPMTFAYPNGRPNVDFDERHETMVEEAGYALAVTTAWEVARAGASLYRLPRIGPWWRQGRTVHGGLLRAYVKSYL